MSALAAADRLLGLLLRAVPVVCLVALFAILFANVASRYFQLYSIAWFDEIVEALFAYLVFVGAAALWREGEHFRVDWLETALTGRHRAALRLLVATLSLAFLCAMTWYGLELTLRSRATTPILAVPTGFVYAAIPIAGAVMTLYSVADVWRTARALLRSPSATNRST